MLRRILFALPLLAIACGSAPGEQPASTEDSALGTWQTMITCNGGAAVLDVDPGERRTAQFVIRDANAINWITGQVNMQVGPLDRGNGRELIVRGWSQNGVFSPGDFQSFGAPLGSGDAQVFRDGAGIKIVIRHDDGIQGGTCSDNQGGWEGGCIGGWVGGTRVMRELANWYFDDCR